MSDVRVFGLVSVARWVDVALAEPECVRVSAWVTLSLWVSAVDFERVSAADGVGSRDFVSVVA